MMMTRVSRLVHALLALALLSGLVGSIQTRQVLASGMAPYTSAANGYTLLLPPSWVRLPRVRWTPAGPPADLTVMTPDHQAALGITVAPTGSRHYSDAELRGLALRLLYQENGVVPTLSVQQVPLIVHGVVFQTAIAPSFSGAVYTYNAKTVISVWLTQRDNRLYAIVGLVYISQAAMPPPGSGMPTPTPTPESGVAPDGWPSRHETIPDRVVPLLAPTAGLAALAPRLARSEDDAPRPLPTDHLRGNPCPDATDGALIYRDKNCAARGELRTLTAMVSSFSFTSRATADQRPAAPVGVDGFAIAASPTLGVRVEYPAQWTALSVANTNLAVRSADQNALVTLVVQRSDTASVALPDLQSFATSLIAQVASGPPPSYQTLQANGILYLRAVAPHAVVTQPGGGFAQAQVSVTVASYHHRIYGLRAIALTYLSSLAANAHPPAMYPYIGPFTTLARSTQSTVDLLTQQSDLAVQATWSLFVDPRVPDAA